MARTPKQTLTAKQKLTATENGFSISLQADTDLGRAILIAEDDKGRCEPVGFADTINEANELADEDLRLRLDLSEIGEDPGICPHTYKLWARGVAGRYRIAYQRGGK